MLAVAVFALILAAALTTPLLLILRLRSTFRFSERRCAKCHYNILGLPSNVCPECGSVLHAGSILPANVRWPIGLWPRLLLWSCVLLLAGIVLLGPASPLCERYLEPAIPVWVTSVYWFELHDPRLHGDEPWMPGAHLIFDIMSSGNEPSVHVHEVVVYASQPPNLYGGWGNDPYQPGLHIRIPDLSYYFELRQPQKTIVEGDGVLSNEKLTKWLISEHRLDDKRFIAAIWSIVQAAQFSPEAVRDLEPDFKQKTLHGLNSRLSGRGGSRRPVIAVDAVVASTVFGIWFLGAFMIFALDRRRRTKRRAQ